MEENNILNVMIKNDLADNRAFVVSHHQVKSPARIDVKADEVAYITEIILDLAVDSWLEFHSATESRLVEKAVPVPAKELFSVVTRHKGNIYFSRSSVFSFDVKFVKLKILR